MGQIESDMATCDSDEYPNLRGAVKIARERRDRLRPEAEAIKAELTADEPLNHAHDIIKVHNAAEGPQCHTLRLRLRALVAELVESVDLKPEKHFGRVHTLVQVNYRTGLVRQFGWRPGWVQTKSGAFSSPICSDESAAKLVL